MKQVKITINEDGSVESEAFGFIGDDCIQATEWLDNLFENKMERHLKDSYYETDFTKLVEGIPSEYCG